MVIARFETIWRSHMTRTRQPNRTRPVRRAFTLIEIIVVVTIIALLAALIVPRIWQRVGQAKTTVARQKATEIAKQLQLYLVDNGSSAVPQDLDLNVLATGPNAYLKPKDLIDPWNKQFNLQVPGTVNPDFDVFSYGADGQIGGEGENEDIYNE
jgi:general secretion pathway protein G